MANIDKNYKLVKINSIGIAKNSYTQIYSYTGRGYLDCLVLAISDTDMSLEIDIDGTKVIDGFTLKDFKSIYGLDSANSLPLNSIDSKTFKYQPRDWQQFDVNVTINLKHNSKTNKNLEGGYITFQTRI